MGMIALAVQGRQRRTPNIGAKKLNVTASVMLQAL
jgi:hypothetical protein